MALWMSIYHWMGCLLDPNNNRKKYFFFQIVYLTEEFGIKNKGETYFWWTHNFVNPDELFAFAIKLAPQLVHFLNNNNSENNNDWI